MKQQELHPPSAFEYSLLTALNTYYCLTIRQFVRLLHKETIPNYLREKLTRLVLGGYVDYQFMPRVTKAGSSPLVYFLTDKGIRFLHEEEEKTPGDAKPRGYLNHTAIVNDIAIAASQLSEHEPSIRLFEMRHERQFKIHPIRLQKNLLIPDLWLHFKLNPPFGSRTNIPMGIMIELDNSASEDSYIIREKARRYIELSHGIYQKEFGIPSLTICFITTVNQNRLTQLRTYVRQELKENKDNADDFLFAMLSPSLFDKSGAIIPRALFCDPIWYSPVDATKKALIERRQQ